MAPGPSVDAVKAQTGEALAGPVQLQPDERFVQLATTPGASTPEIVTAGWAPDRSSAVVAGLSTV